MRGFLARNGQQKHRSRSGNSHNRPLFCAHVGFQRNGHAEPRTSRPRSGNSHNQRKQQNIESFSAFGMFLFPFYTNACMHAGLEAETRTPTQTGKQQNFNFPETWPSGNTHILQSARHRSGNSCNQDKQRLSTNTHAHTHTHPSAVFCTSGEILELSGCSPFVFPPKKSPTF